MTALDDLAARLAALEARFERGQVPVDSLPIADLRLKMADGWEPAADTFVLRHSVGNDSLADDGVDARVLADDSVASTNIIDGTVTDTDLASPNNVVYKTIMAAAAHAVGVAGGNTFMFCEDGTLRGNTVAAAGQPPKMFWLDPADYVVAGKTARLRIRAQNTVNGTLPGVTFTFGMANVTAVAGAAGLLAYTLAGFGLGPAPGVGTINTLTQTVSADFAMPGAAGYYVPTVAIGGAQAAGSDVGSFIQITTHNT